MRPHRYPRTRWIIFQQLSCVPPTFCIQTINRHGRHEEQVSRKSVNIVQVRIHQRNSQSRCCSDHHWLADHLWSLNTVSDVLAADNFRSNTGPSEIDTATQRLAVTAGRIRVSGDSSYWHVVVPGSGS